MVRWILFGLAIIVIALLSFTVKKVYNFFDDKEIWQRVSMWAKQIVLYVEQCYSGTMTSAEKFDEAFAALSEILETNGIKLTEKEIEVFLEAALGEFREVFKNS